MEQLWYFLLRNGAAVVFLIIQMPERHGGSRGVTGGPPCDNVTGGGPVTPRDVSQGDPPVTPRDSP